MALRGSCLCGGVYYEIRGSLGPAINCRCSMCRKVTGSADFPRYGESMDGTICTS
jgi:hypothetical protein